jgi:hypothetical protein
MQQRGGLKPGVLAVALLAFAPGLADSPHGVGKPGIQLLAPAMTAEPGELVDVPILLQTDTPLALASFSLEFDNAILEVVDVRLSARMQQIVSRLDHVRDVDWSFEWFSNESEGWVQGLLVADFGGRETFVIPPGEVLPLSIITFRVKADAIEGPTSLRFTRPESAGYRGHFADGERPIYNAVRQHGRPFPPEERFRDTLDPEVEDGSVEVSIIGDVGIFVRGDANMDSGIDVSDPIRILGALFLGEDNFPCSDAADANDDGGIDISDPVNILDYLFTGLSTERFGLQVTDRTPDSLDCATGL